MMTDLRLANAINRLRLSNILRTRYSDKRFGNNLYQIIHTTIHMSDHPSNTIQTGLRVYIFAIIVKMSAHL